jgi:hypothetical protein
VFLFKSELEKYWSTGVLAEHKKEDSIKLNIKQAKFIHCKTNIVETDKHYWYYFVCDLYFYL